MLIECPHCGTRPLDEFTFLGDAEPERPPSNDPASTDQWFDYVYLRNNPRGRFHEYAHHAGGCRAWLVVTRDTQTHEVSAVVTARDFAHKRREAQG
jgi:heterotetrameric sarcosine oxidase delta subunit